MNCLDDNFISAYCEGLLSDTEVQHLRAHLDTCAECNSLLQVLTRPRVPAARREDPLIGQLLANTYRLTHAIGSGGMGRVYAAEQVRLQRRVAVKILGAELCNHPEALERFKREARVCAGLGNHHIVDVLDFNQMDDGTPYMVMELLEGEDLAQRITLNGPISPAHMVPIMQQVCSALACTHDEDILHRDLKPSNIFLCEEEGEAPFVKVLDFGISKARGSLATLTHSREVLGTPAYMSPEMATAQHEQVGPHSDLFALGAIAYEALAGRRAFTADSIPAVLYNIVHDAPPHLQQVAPGVPPELCSLVMQLLEKDITKRPANARAVARALSQVPLGTADSPGHADSILTVGTAPTLSISPTSNTMASAGAPQRLTQRSAPARVLLLVGGAALIALAIGIGFLAVSPAPKTADQAPGATKGAIDKQADQPDRRPQVQGPHQVHLSTPSPLAKKETRLKPDAALKPAKPTSPSSVPLPEAKQRGPRGHRKGQPSSPSVDPDPIL